METITILLAGGTGQRFGENIPKQFFDVLGKPIIIYTIESLRKCKQLNKIIIVCTKEYIKYLNMLLIKYNLTKGIEIIEGGESGPESTEKGIDYLNFNKYSKNTIVVIHDANRPFINESLITNLIKKCKEKGNAVCAVIERDLIMRSKDGIKADEVFNEYNMYKIQKPECYRLKDLNEVYKKAKESNIKEFKATCHLYKILGKELFFSEGNINNMKITYKEDIELMKKYLEKEMN